ncbi:hypothetical protein [Vibrio vulnificus YJ016]|uniref:Uncharacterized protein n=1 Tax=Vibrio vulnificus (strain YJ016) TaxID=196600 RepID=Q7MDG4_VIBVY|nr:hypothetical protein [Vibrio vulnificus YJ016]
MPKEHIKKGMLSAFCHFFRLIFARIAAVLFGYNQHQFDTSVALASVD